MKKLALVVAVLALVLSFGLVACTKSETVTGEYKYDVSYGGTPITYGCKVDVTVANGKITKVKLYEDKETGWTQITSSWKENSPMEGALGHDKCLAATPDYLKKFEGKSVEDVKKVAVSIKGQNEATENKIADEAFAFAGATQSGARIILAVQNALSKLK